jgi:AbiV family abortive infection protein
MSNLPFRVCLQGLEVIDENARRLWSEAQHLRARGNFLSATLLGCYSFDEFGKLMIVAQSVFAAERQGKTFITKDELDKGGFNKHAKKLAFVSNILAPILTGLPPGLAITTEQIDALQEEIWELRNAAAYVDVNNGVFLSPQAIPRDRCDKVLNTLSTFISIMQKNVQPYLAAELKRLKIS